MITHPDYGTTVPPRALGKVLDQLRSDGHIAHHLTFVSGMDPAKYETLAPDIQTKLTNPRRYGQPKGKHDKSNCASYMGVFHSPCIQGKCRRVDIKFYPYRERVYASLYFTGNGHFNRAMRLWATRKLSYTLNDHGLFAAGTSTSVMEAQTEKGVFEKLGLAWKEVTERDCFDAVHGKGNGESALQLRELSRTALREENERHAWVS
jgi:hypothetical protein